MNVTDLLASDPFPDGHGPPPLGATALQVLNVVLPELNGIERYDLACSFCPDGADKEGCRLRASKLVVDEMEFNYPPEHALAICEELKERQLHIRWAADINPVGVSRELVTAMKEAGCRVLSLGIDTASKKMLRSYQKDFDKEDIVRVVRLLTEAGIRFTYHVLFGGAGEKT